MSQTLAANSYLTLAYTSHSKKCFIVLVPRISGASVLADAAGFPSLLPQPHLLQDSDQELVDVVLDSGRRLDELHLAVRG